MEENERNQEKTNDKTSHPNPRLNTLQAAPGIPFLADQRPPSPPRLNTTCVMALATKQTVSNQLLGCKESFQFLFSLFYAQCWSSGKRKRVDIPENWNNQKRTHPPLEVPEWGKQWYDGLRPEDPGDLASVFASLSFVLVPGCFEVYGSKSTINYHNYGDLAMCWS